MNIEKKASRFLTELLGKFAGIDLTDEESQAASMLLCTLPDSACIKDFIKAARSEEVERAGLPSNIAEVLAPLVTRLELNLPYAGRFASLFESATNIASMPVSLF